MRDESGAFNGMCSQVLETTSRVLAEREARELAQTMEERTTDEWLALFRDLEIPAAPLNTPDALFDDPHLNAVGLFETIDTPHGKVKFPGVPTWFSRTPGKVRGPAPELGADTAAVLRELGLGTPDSVGLG